MHIFETKKTSRVLINIRDLELSKIKRHVLEICRFCVSQRKEKWIKMKLTDGT